METVNTKEFAKKLKELGVVSSVTEGVEATRIIFGLVADLVESGKVVCIRGFGTFQPRIRKGGRRKLRGEEMFVPDRNVMTFRSSTVLRKFLNDPEETNPLFRAAHIIFEGEEATEEDE